MSGEEGGIPSAYREENVELYWNISYASAITSLVVGPIGVFLNGMILLAIYRIKKFRKVSHYLLALLAFSDVGTSAILVNQALLILTGHVLIVSATCFLKMFWCHFLIYFSSAIMLGVGVDRLYAVTWPLKYSHSKKRVFLSFIVLLAVSTAVVGVVLGAISTDKVTVVANCGTSNSLGGVGRRMFELTNMGLTLLAILVYCLAFYKTKRRAAQNSIKNGSDHRTVSEIETDKQNQNLMTSLMIILAFAVFSRFAGFAFAMTVRRLPIQDPMMKSAISIFSGLASLPDKYTNFFIFGLRSKDYSKEFRKILHMKIPQGQVKSQASRNTAQEVVPKQKVIMVAPQNANNPSTS